MLKKDKVILKNTSIGETDEYGGYVPGIETSKEIMADVQPYSRELMLKKYGYDIEVSKLMFCNVDLEIKEGSIIIFNSKDYEVKKIPWDAGHMEVILNGL